MHINMTAVYPNPSDGTSFYRGAGPWSMLRKQLRKAGVNLNIERPDRVTWSNLVDKDLVFLQRPMGQQHSLLAEITKRVGVKLWIDYDDAIFDLTPDNPSYDMYATEDFRSVNQTCMELADVITVSTESLRDTLPEKHREKVVIIPNAWNDGLFPDFNTRKTDDKPRRIAWRGSATHQEDLFPIVSAVTMLAEANPEWEWHFFGWRPWYFQHLLNFHHHPMTDVIIYTQQLRECNPRIMFYSLKDTVFNRSKSNIGWMEATYAGAATVGPNLPEWTGRGMVNYSSQEEFTKGLYYLMQAKGKELDGRIASCQSLLQSKLLLTQVNRLRLDVLKNLIPHLIR